MNKKAQNDFIMYLILGIVGFIIVVTVIELIAHEVSSKASEATCRTSVLANGKFAVNIAGIKTVSTPLLCSTQKKTVSGTPDQITQQIATLVDNCWWEFAQGTVADPFHAGTAGGQDNCFVCYEVTIDNQKYQESNQQLLQYMSQTTYQIDSSGKQISNYLSYIQSGNTPGNILLSDMQGSDIYAISYGAVNTNCGGWCKAGAFIGGTGGILLAGATAAAVCSWVPIIGTITCGVGYTLGAAIVGSVSGAKGAATLVQIIAKRGIPTVYLTPLSTISTGGICNVQT